MQEENVHIKAILDAAEIRKKVWELAEKGRSEEGVAILEKAAKEHPENHFLFTFGLFYLFSEKAHLEHYRQHMEDWAKIGAEQGRSEAALMLGRLYMEKEGKMKESVVWLGKAPLLRTKRRPGKLPAGWEKSIFMAVTMLRLMEIRQRPFSGKRQTWEMAKVCTF